MLLKFILFTIFLSTVSGCGIPQSPGDCCHPLSNPCNGVQDTECKFWSDSSSYHCICHDRLITDFTNKRCIQKPAKPGDPCAPGLATCDHIPHTSCDGRICKCNGDLVTLPGRCLSLPQLPGDECHVTLADCSAVPLASTCYFSTSWFCKCDGDLVTDPLGKQCLKKPERPGNPCHPDMTPCTGIVNTTCNLGDFGDYLCKCNDGYFTDVVGEKCLKIPTSPGDPCHQLTPCIGVTNTTCLLGQDGLFCKCDGDLVTDLEGKQCLKRPTYPGDSCHPTLTSCDGIENTTCDPESYICKCTSGFVNEGRRCLKLPQAPGQECHPFIATCAGIPQTECSSHEDKYICMCNAGLVTDIPNARCVSPPNLPGDPCVVTLAPCTSVPNTTCTNFPPNSPSICLCHENEFVTDFLGQRCMKIPTRPGHGCELPYTNCVQTSEPCMCEPNDDGKFFCKCSDPDKVTDPEAGLCLIKPSMPGDSCHSTLTPCTGVLNTTCQLVDGSSVCTCVEPFITDPGRGKCLRVPTKPGDSCHPTLTPCHGIQHTDCRLSAGIDFTCECINDLITDPQHGICISEPLKAGDLCHPSSAPCEFSTETECVENGENYMCKCRGDLITDPINGKCVRVPTHPGDPCDPILADCNGVNNTECVRKSENGDFFCKCNAGLITDEAGKRCIRIPGKPGDECALEIDLCHVASVNTTCVDVEGDGKGAFCKCIPDFITEEGKCFNLPLAPGDTCGPVQAPCDNIPLTTCRTDGDSNGFYCKCIDGYFNDFTRRACVPQPKKVGDECDARNSTACLAISYTNCVLTNTGLVHKCMCIDGYFQDGDQCIKNPARPLDRCVDQTHCINIPHTECAFPSIGAPHKVCLCAFNFDPSQDLSRCIRKAEFLNDYCDSFLQCTLLTNTVCEGSKCRCKGNTVESSTRKSCLPLVEYLGENCTENIQCTEGIGSNTECREESLTCECLQPGWVGNAGGDGCLKTADIGEPCQVDAQCTAELGEESTCTNKNECQCKGGASYLNKGCHRPSLLHRPCKANEECVLGINEYAHCMEQACECQEDAIEWNRFCYANLKIGSQCKSNEECFVPIPESSCVNLTCVCNHGMGSEFGANTCSGSGRIQFLFVVEMLFGLLSLVSCYLL